MTKVTSAPTYQRDLQRIRLLIHCLSEVRTLPPATAPGIPHWELAEVGVGVGYSVLLCR